MPNLTRRTTNRLIAGAITLALVPLAAPQLAAQTPQTTVQWFGQAAFKVTSPKGTVVMIDPFLTRNPKTPAEHKDLSKLGKVDLILVTHGHGDHFGDTAQLAKMTGAKVGMNADMGSTVQSLGIVPGKQLIRFNKSGPIKVGDVTVIMVRAEHSSSIRRKNPVTGKVEVYPGGEPVGYILKIAGGPTVYHAGDTGVFGDMKWIGDYYKPDLALLPIGGHFTMDPAHAAYAQRYLINARMVVPMHYGTFPPLKGTPAQFKAALGAAAGTVLDMKPGDAKQF